MVIKFFLGALVAIAVYLIGSTYRNFRRNLALAKSSGLPIVVAPWNIFSRFWLATHTIWTPLVKKIVPTAFQGLWVQYVHIYAIAFRLTLTSSPDS